MHIELGDSLKLGSLSITLEPEVRESRATMILPSPDSVSGVVPPCIRTACWSAVYSGSDHLLISLELGAHHVQMDGGRQAKNYFCSFLIASNFIEEMWSFFLLCCQLWSLIDKLCILSLLWL